VAPLLANDDTAVVRIKRFAPLNVGHVQTRDDHGAGVDSGRSLHFRQEPERGGQYFWFEPKQEPEFTLRSVQEPIKIFREPFEIFAIMLVVVKQNGINSDVFSN